MQDWVRGYQVYNLELSDCGYFFKTKEVDKPNYLWLNSEKVFPNNGNYAKSILVLGQNELYVVLWNSGLWFLDSDLKFITNENLLLNPHLNNTHSAQLWQSYIEDVFHRIFYALNTPKLLENFPDFVPDEIFFHGCVSQDFHLIINRFFPSVVNTFVNLLNNQDPLCNNHYPPIQKDYLLQSLDLSLGKEFQDKWKDRAILAGHIEINCPFSGKIIKSNESIYFTHHMYSNFVAYRFESYGEIFFLICGLHRSVKAGLYFPRRNIVFFRPFYYGRIENFAHWFWIEIIGHWKLIKYYLLNPNTREIAVLNYSHQHLGHNLWNGLSSLEHLEKNNILSKILNLYVLDKDLYTPMEELYPTLQGKIRRISSSEEIHDFYKHNKFVIVLGHCFIPQSLADKIINYSLSSSVKQSFSQDLQGFVKENFSLVILFTLRFNNRSWLEQEKGICEIIIRLSETFSGSIALIIDGKNTSFSGEKLSSHGEWLMKENLSDLEYTTAERIKATISSDRITVINTIGCSLAESVHWSFICDFFIAPWGAGLAKYKWITNSPGLIYSSRKVLMEKEDLHIYDSSEYREDAYPCEYVDPLMVFDQGEDFKIGQPFRDNFSLSMEHLYEKIVSMCERFGRLHCDQQNIIKKDNLVIPTSLNEETQSQIYPIYSVELSDSGYFFKKSEVDEPNYLWFGSQKVFPSNEHYAKSILVLGQDELYVVLWNSGLWFLDANLNFIATQNLLIDPNFQNTDVAKLWRSYLEDILPRILQKMTTPGFFHDFPDFAPEEKFIHFCVWEDVKQIINDLNPSFCQVAVAELDNQVHLLNRHFPPIQKDYLLYSLDLVPDGTKLDNWQDRAILEGCVEIKCPFSGEMIQSNESIYCTSFTKGKTLSYRFESNGEVFFLITGAIHSEKAGFYFPNRNTAFWINGFYVYDGFLSWFLISIVQDLELIQPYLSNNKSRQVAVLALLNGHLGHNLWNDLSGLDRLDKNNILSQLPNLYLLVGPTLEMWAPTEEIFPVLQGKIHRVPSLEQLQNFYKDNKFVVVVSDEFITKNLADKIINYSLSSSVKQSFSQDLQGFVKESFSRVILFTLRFNNRSWLEQEEGICEIIIRLSETFSGSIALIIDGKNTSLNGEKLSSYGEWLMKENLSDLEYTTAERIKATISSDKITVINTIGCSLVESVHWSFICDFFVAPWGAGLAKYKWITNTPGLIYSSRKVLMEKGDLHIYDSPEYREDAYPCEYVDPLMVFDQGEDFQVGQPFRDNFSLSMEHLYEKIVSMCERFGRVNECNVNFDNDIICNTPDSF